MRLTCVLCATYVRLMCALSLSWLRLVMAQMGHGAQYRVLNTSTCFRYLNVTFVEIYGIGWWRWGRHMCALVLGTRAHLGLVALQPRDTWARVPSWP